MAAPKDRRTDAREDDTELLDVELQETLAADAIPEIEPEIDAASEDEALELDREAHASEDIIGDVDGDDYRAGTLDPEDSDRGPWRELSEERLDGDLPRDERPGGGALA